MPGFFYTQKIIWLEILEMIMKKLNVSHQNFLSHYLTVKQNRTSAILFDHVDDANLAYIALHPGMSQSHHYHKEGADIFIITRGNGTLRYGDVCPDSGLVSNLQSVRVTEGDVYFVEPLQMHALYNDSDSNELIFLNIAPKGHAEADNFEV